MQHKEINFQCLLDISRHMTLDEFHSRYKNVKIIHKTRNSTVRLAIHIQTGQNVIVKSVYKNSIVNSPLKIESILKEVNVLTFLRESKHVTQIYDVVYCLDSFHIVLEYAECGDLFNYINNRSKTLSEAEVKHFFRPIAKTIAMIHRNKIAHRDLKLENVLFDNSGRIMIADFGFATKFNRKVPNSNPDQSETSEDSELCSSICGTVNYEPPEIIQGDKYDPMKADSWSVGVILYVLMFKYFPFYSPSITDTVQLILSSEVKYPDNMRETFSDELCDILLSLLVKDPKKRLYIEDVVNSHQTLFGHHTTPNNCLNGGIGGPTDEESYGRNSDDFNIFNTDSLNSLFGMNSTAPIGNVMKQERIHNSALNTITRSKDDFQNLSADEFIAYQIIKRRYQLGQIKYMKARYKSIAPGEFLKIPNSSEGAQAATATTNTNSNLDLKRVVITSNKTQPKTYTDEYSDEDDDDIDTNLIDDDEDTKSDNSNVKESDESVDIDVDDQPERPTENQINLSEFYSKQQQQQNNSNSNSNAASKKSRKSLNRQYRGSLNAQLPAYNPEPAPMEVVGQKKPRQMSPVGARRIIKVRARNKKSPSLSPSSPVLASPSNPGRALPSFLVSNSAPLSSQLPPPPSSSSCSIFSGKSDDVIECIDDNSNSSASFLIESEPEKPERIEKTEIYAKPRSKKLSKDIKVPHNNASSLTNISGLIRQEKTKKMPNTEIMKLPNLSPVDQLSSLPAIQIDQNDGLDGLENRSILNVPDSDDAIRYKKSDSNENEENVPSILTGSSKKVDLSTVHSRKRNVNHSQLARKTSGQIGPQMNTENDKNAHKTNLCLESLIKKVNEFIDRHDDITLICEEESGAFVKYGTDDNNDLMALISFSRTGSKSSSFSIDRIRGSDELLGKLEALIVSEIGV